MSCDDWERNDKIDAELCFLRAENAELKKCLRQMFEAYMELDPLEEMATLCTCGDEDCQDAFKIKAMDEALRQAKVALSLF